jgi:MFS family permease
LAIACVASACLAVITPLAGRFADRHSLRKKLLAWTITLSVLLAWPAFYLLSLSTNLCNYHDSRLNAGYAAMAGAHRLSECLPGGHLMMCPRCPVLNRQFP